MLTGLSDDSGIGHLVYQSVTTTNDSRLGRGGGGGTVQVKNTCIPLDTWAKMTG